MIGNIYQRIEENFLNAAVVAPPASSQGIRVKEDFLDALILR
jgi:hypothetical protein